MTRDPDTDDRTEIEILRKVVDELIRRITRLEINAGIKPQPGDDVGEPVARIHLEEGDGP